MIELLRDVDKATGHITFTRKGQEYELSFWIYPIRTVIALITLRAFVKVWRKLR